MDVTVGLSGAEINGDTNAAVQAAIDRAAATGGGTVTLLPGTYTIWDRIVMRTDTKLAGSGDETILQMPDGWEAALWEDGDWGNVWASCDSLPPVKVGHGVHLYSGRDRGWNSTVGTVLEIRESRVRVSQPFNGNHMVQDKARISSAHSIIDVEDAEHVSISDLVIDGNAAKNFRADGCRGGAIHGLRSHNVTVTGVTVRDFNGDAISFQSSDDWTIENCVTEDNAGHGLHPGTGAQRPVIRGCISRRNGNCGMYVCWRVQHGVFEDSRFEENTIAGISIGHKDSDNVFRRNRIINNTGPGIRNRKEKAPMCADRCVYESNVIQGNNGGGPQVVLDGEVRDLVFRDNTYDDAPRFEVGPDVANLTAEEGC